MVTSLTEAATNSKITFNYYEKDYCNASSLGGNLPTFSAPNN